MTTDLPPVPPTVLQFAEQHNIKNVEKDTIFNIKKSVFKYDNIDEAYSGISNPLITFKKEKDFMYTHCTYILVEKGKIRLANPEETEKLNRVFFM